MELFGKLTLLSIIKTKDITGDRDLESPWDPQLPPTSPLRSLQSLQYDVLYPHGLDSGKESSTKNVTGKENKQPAAQTGGVLVHVGPCLQGVEPVSLAQDRHCLESSEYEGITLDINVMGFVFSAVCLMVDWRNFKSQQTSCWLTEGSNSWMNAGDENIHSCSLTERWEWFKLNV